MRLDAMNPYEFGARWIGMREKAGPANDPFVAFVNWLAGGPPTDEEAWCGAFANFVAFSRGLERPALPRRARSWLTVGALIYAPERVGVVDPPQVGDIIVLSRGPLPQPGPGVLSAPGHVGIVAPDAGQPADYIRVLGGNQGNAVSIQAFPIERILGVRRLLEAAI